MILCPPVARLFRTGVPLWVVACLLVPSQPASPHNPITTTVVFNREVAAILNQKCRPCHVAEGMAMPLQTYADARPWAIAIKEEILARQMPPWPAERGFGAFANDTSLTLREREFLISWVDGGAPEGTGEPPAHMDHGAHWMLGAPDAIYEATRTPGAALAPNLTRFTVDTGLRKAAWMRAMDFKPADLRAIRAVFFSVAGTGQYLGGWTIAHPSIPLPDGIAVRLPAQAVINVDVLSGPAPSGPALSGPALSGPALPWPTPSASSDRPPAPPRLALYFTRAARQAVAHLVLTGARVAEDGRMRVALPLAADSALVELRVEMSPGGKSLELTATHPDGAVQPLLWIREFSQDWQTSYVFRSPVPLPRGTVLRAAASFDMPAAAPHLRVLINAARRVPEASSRAAPPSRPERPQRP